jgi:hypothetical protein
MFENLKRMAIQRLTQKMAGNALSEAATGEAAQEGASAFMETIQNKLAGGNMEQVKELFSGGNMESNDIFQNAKQQLSQVLQNKGMSAEEATAEAEATAPDLINGLKEKFESTSEEDSQFDLASLSKWIPGNAGDLLKGGAGDLLGNAGGLLNKAKNLLG